jgi:hypothetical protein
VDILGHSRVSLTLEIYTDGMRTRAVEPLGGSATNYGVISRVTAPFAALQDLRRVPVAVTSAVATAKRPARGWAVGL